MMLRWLFDAMELIGRQKREAIEGREEKGGKLIYFSLHLFI